MDKSIKTSLLIPSQLPDYIRDDKNYNSFVDFLTAYYEWLESNGNVLYHSKNLLSYQDIDEYQDEIRTMLKAYNIRPVVLNQIIDKYSEVIQTYYDEGKFPKLFVDEIIKDFELDSGGFLSYKVGSKSYNQTIKYL